MMLPTKFRHSSHSTDYTIVATFSDPVEAMEKMAKVAHDSCEKLELADETCKNKGLMCVCEAYESDAKRVAKKLEKIGGKDVTVYTTYQRLTATFILPSWATEKIVALAGGLDAILSRNLRQIYHELSEHCEKPKIRRNRRHVEWKFTYKGDRIFFPDKEGGRFMDWHRWIKPCRKIRIKENKSGE